MLLITQDDFQKHLLIHKDGTYYAKYNGLLLESVFQPIFNKKEQVYGYEALLRIKNIKMEAIRPDLFFKDKNRTLEEILNVERLSRVIHIRNFAQFCNTDALLFLNVLPVSAVKFYSHKLPDFNSCLLESRIKELNLAPSNLVLELLEIHYDDEQKLLESINEIKSHGFHVAIDDFGSEASCKERVSLLNPNILKIDRSLLLEYESGDTFALMSALELSKKEKLLTIIEGVETLKQYNRMKTLGIDYFQGFYLGRPMKLNKQQHQVA